MMLFSDITRTAVDSKSDEESHYSYLNRIAWIEASTIRGVLQDWFSRYPTSEKKRFLSRFCTDDDISFLSSFFELYLHELLLRLNYTVELETLSSSGKRPDFLVRSADGNEFFMEAVLATGMSDEEIAAEKRKNIVYGSLEKIESPDFFICMNISGNPTEPPSGKKLRKKISLWLESLNYEDLLAKLINEGKSAMPKLGYSEKGWNIEFYVLPKQSARGKTGIRPVGLKFFGFRFRDTRTAIRDAITRKATRYGELGNPYVVAVNSLQWPIDQIAIMEALFGKEVWSVPRTGFEGEPEMRRRPDGAWTCEKGPQNTRVSAVLLGVSIHPWTMVDDKGDLLLCHNPWAQFNCNGKITELSELVYRGDSMWKKSGIHPRVILGLPAKWPKI
ncbi:MAG: hypothetical protein ACLQPD_16405 [Desulfomonilaceae bacterium]